MKRYSPLVQGDEWGCGAACVASLLGVTYKKTKALLGHKHPDKGYKGYSCAELSRGLRRGGLAYRGRLCARRKDDAIPVGAIVFLSRKAGKFEGSGHYLLRTPAGWMDPWSNYPDPSRKAKISTRRPRNVSHVLLPRV